MHATLRTKLLAILGVATLSFAVLLLTSAAGDARMETELRSIASLHVPNLELAPKLGARLDHLRRALQDAVAAEDLDALEDTHRLKDELLAQVQATQSSTSPLESAAFRAAVEDYYRTAYDVSRRLLAQETGEPLLLAMASMQTKQTRATELLERAADSAQRGLKRAFEQAAAAQASLRNTRLAISLGCISIVLVLSLWLSQRILHAVNELGAGLVRFGIGDFRQPIRALSHDEFGELARKANEMAQNLERLQSERDVSDWQKAGHAGLVRELQGDMEPTQVAKHSVRFLARYLKAPAGAIYQVDEAGDLQLLGHYGATAQSGDSVRARIAADDGLLGRAAGEQEVTVIRQIPTTYLIRSGLGEASPTALAFTPLLHLGKVVGVLELAFFEDPPDAAIKLLEASRETVAISLEVARSRSAVRDLLVETQNQANQLALQEEELRTANEGLQQRQQELHDINTALTRQTDALEGQRQQLERKNHELTEVRNKLEKKAEELGTVSAYKSQFLANMSHELRTPLNSMLLLSGLLGDNESGNLTEKQVEYCRTVYEAGKNLLALINQVLDLSKVEAGKQDVHLESVALQAIAQRTQRLFEPLARDKGLELHLDFQAHALPDVIVTDPQRVEQILNNLLGNAIKFTERGSVTLRIARPDAETELARRDLARERCVAFSVQDTGIGIEPSQQDRIFSPFEQLESSPDRRYGGTGLGLTIARELANLLSGELQLKSVMGKGSTFVLVLPFEPPRTSRSASSLLPPVRVPIKTEREVAPARPQPVVSLAPAERVELLIIEDDPTFSAALGDVIRSQGLSCLIASDGESGLRLAKLHKPRGIVLDVKLSDIDGFTVMQLLLADPATRDIPVHFVSGLNAPERGMALGAVGYLTKPATRDELLGLVAALVPQAKSRACRVLIIEDDHALGDSLLQSLLKEGFEGECARNAEQGLACLRREAFDCLVLDLGLPDMSGLELLSALRTQAITTPPVIVYTGRPLTKAERDSLKAYTEAVVMKDGSAASLVLEELRAFARRLKDGAHAKAADSKVTPDSAVRWKGKKILVADDDMRAAYALSALLRARGAEPLVADTGRAALDTLSEHPDIDAVLIDIIMPEMDGYEAMRQIRLLPRFRELPIIAVTARQMKVDRQQCLEAGATGYITKPVEPELLFAMLQSSLASERPTDA